MKQQLRVLVVEDDDDTRANLEDILALDDYQVLTASSSTGAIQILERQSPDVIILDRKLPDAMAEALFPRLRQVAPQADVIIVTAYADLDGTISALRHGAVDYIIKPINPDALRNSIRRIADRRQMELALQEERQFAEKILNTTEAIILVLDASGIIVRFNPYLERLSGFRLEDVRGLHWCEVFIPELERQRVWDVFRRTRKGRESHGIQNPILTKDGGQCEVRWSNTHLKDEHGKITHILAVGLDVTDQMRAQQKLLQSERLATIGQTMAGLAHESRNALQRIRAGIELLEMTCEDQPEALRDLERIQRASDDLRNLLDEVRSYAAPIHLERHPTTIASVWRRAWDTLSSTRNGRDVSLTDERVNNTQFNVDGRRLEQVFRNLFENSLSASSDPVRITISSYPTEHGCRIVVRDNGPGIPPEHGQKAFDPFFTTKTDGTGLGLAIVRRIVEAHGGTIQPGHSSGAGAEFIIELPRE